MALSTNLVSYWKLDESSGNASDSVGSNTATNSNVTYGTGKINNGAIFNGSSSAFTFATVPVTGSSSFSVSFWLKAGSLVSGMSALHFGTDASNQAFNVYLDASSKIAANFTGGGGQVTSTTSLSTSVFQLFTLTYDGTNVRLYVNGTLENTSSSYTSANIGTTNKFIGKYAGNTNWWNGSIDEIGMWSRALTGSEVTQLYNGGAGVEYPFGSSYTITAGVGAFVLTGITTAFTKAMRMAVTVGNFTLTGLSVIFRLGKGMVAGVGQFILTGNPANLIGPARTVWTNITKPNTSWTDSNKPSTTWTDIPK